MTPDDLRKLSRRLLDARETYIRSDIYRITNEASVALLDAAHTICQLKESLNRSECEIYRHINKLESKQVKP